jgi:hypothetical protein
MIRTLAIENYRSLRRVIMPLTGLDFGETRIEGQEMLDEPAWHWPKR